MDERSPYLPPSLDPSKPASIAPSTDTAKKTWFWYVVYCIGMSLLYLVLIGAGTVLFFLALSLENMSEEDHIEAIITSVVYVVIGTPCLIAYAIGPFLRRGKFAWVYGIILIALGMTSCCTLPACIPLLIFWLRPDFRSSMGAA